MTTLLGNRYELISLLATGGMGQVWRARDALLNRPVAVKVLRSEYTGDETFLARFRAEAQHTAALAHRTIAALFDYGEVPAGDGREEHVAYLVMELVEGESLSALLAREGRLDAVRTLDILQQTATALAVAHRGGVVHRDVKPGNVLVAADGTVKITDFGIAWSASSVPLTRTGQVVGTAHYLSPEQAAGSKAGPASDVYALGLIGYECLAGQRAFDGENSVQIALAQLRDLPDPLPDDVPEGVRALIGRALVKDPAERFADGAAFQAAVEDVQAGRALPPAATPGTRTFALPAPRTESAGASGRRRRGPRMLVPLATLLVGAGVGIAALQVVGDAAGSAPVAAAGTAPAGIVLSARDFVGRPVADVEDELGRRGLRVQPVPVTTDTVPAGTVTAVGPVGTVAPGALITVSYAVAPPAAPPVAVPAPPVAGAGGTVPAAAVPAASAPAGSSDGPHGSSGTAASGQGKSKAAHPGNGGGRGRGKSG